MSSDVLNGRSIGSVFIGGGTPSVLNERQMELLLGTAREHPGVGKGAEITVEANPATLTDVKMKLLRHAGVTRLSLGVQTFNDDELVRLGRAHTADQAQAAFTAARKAAFSSVGIDLLYGIPGQGPADWMRTIRTALGIRPDHLSLYCLSADDGSLLARAVRSGTTVLPSDEQAADMFEQACAVLGTAGYVQYEVSNFSLPGHECRHNLHYWGHGEYLGLGPSATSFIGDQRWTNAADVRRYSGLLRAGVLPRAASERLTRAQLRNEMVMLALRTRAGLDLERYAERFSEEERTALVDRAGGLVRSGHLRRAGNTLTLEPGYMLLMNEVLSRLIS